MFQSMQDHLYADMIKPAKPQNLIKPLAAESWENLIHENQILKNQVRHLSIEKEESILKQHTREEWAKLFIHDLKIPLMVVHGFAKRLNKTIDKNGEIENKHLVSVILNSSMQLQNLIEEQLTPKLIHEVHDDGMDWFNLKETITKTLQEHRHIFQLKKLNLKVSNLDDTIMIQGLQKNMIKALSNLLSNAFKFSPEASTIEILVEQKEKQVLIQVFDKGPGISSEEQKKLFKKHTQLSKKPIGYENSSGLGLYFVKLLIENLHGRVWCKSELGKGSNFFIKLPCISVNKLFYH